MSDLMARSVERRSLAEARGSEARYSLRRRFEQLLGRAAVVVLQQGEVEAVLVRPAADAHVQGLHLHQ